MTDAERLVWVYQLPYSIWFRGDALGCQYPARIGGLNTCVSLPSLTVGESGEPVIGAPIVDAAAHELALVAEREEEGLGYNFWAGIDQFSLDNPIASAVVNVSSVAISASENTTGISKFAESLPEHMALWFEGVRDWIQVLAKQPLVSAESVVMRGHGLDIFRVTSDSASRVRPQQTITIVQREIEPVSAATWVTALERVTSEQKPPPEHKFIASARAAFFLQDHRKAVLDAGTGVELALTRVLDTMLAPLDPGVHEALREQRRTLGALIDLLAKAGVLPGGLSGRQLTNGLTNIRNRAVHQGSTPTRDEAETALELSTKVVNSVVDLS